MTFKNIIMSGLKTTELFPCAQCGGIHEMDIYEVSVNRHFVSSRNVQKHVGLSMQIGEQLANVMGPNEDMTIKISKGKVLICQDCFLSSELGSTLFESLEDTEEFKKLGGEI